MVQETADTFGLILVTLLFVLNQLLTRNLMLGVFTYPLNLGTLLIKPHFVVLCYHHTTRFMPFFLIKLAQGGV